MPYGLFTRGVTHWSSAFLSDFLNRCLIFPQRPAASRMWKLVQGLCGLVPQLPQLWLYAVLKDLR